VLQKTHAALVTHNPIADRLHEVNEQIFGFGRPVRHQGYFEVGAYSPTDLVGADEQRVVTHCSV
jgi:hypothetical protein